jgi:Zn-dependent peptidase ImmA (M78 family)/transcriptional regulator with XRE-family HTH domain
VTDVPVNPGVLAWARSERGLTLADAAERLGVPEEELKELEDGARMPTVGELRNMAAKYEIGFSALLMPEPLPATTRLRVDDFRTHRGEGAAWNPELLAALDDINIFTDAMADLKQAVPELIRSNLPTLNSNSNVANAAERERERMGFTIDQQFGWSKYIFRRFRSMIEAQGVFVYVMNVGTTEDWRGLAIMDERDIPFIALNGNEAETEARVFSLIHEYCHILLRVSAISDQRQRGTIEGFCNSFAAFFLMPRQDFRAATREIGGRTFKNDWSDEELKKIGERFKVSMSAAAIHLERLDLAPTGFYRAKLTEWRVRTPRKREGGIIPYYEQVANRLGNRHVSVVFEALDRGYIDQLDAYEMLDVKPESFPRLQSEITERQRAYGWGQ